MASSVLALPLDRKVYAPPEMAPERPALLPLCISTIAVTAMPERTWRTVRIMVMTDIYFNPFKVYRFNSHKSIT